MTQPNGQWTARGINMMLGAVCGFIATLPWLVACVGWASHWNAYTNLFLTLGGGVLWLTFFKASQRASSQFDDMDEDDLREMIFSLSKTLGKP